MAFKSYVALLLAIFFMSCDYQIAEGERINSTEDDTELEEQLRILNKPAVKSIQDESGILFDCINIYEQPAFSNPLLKNHTIQMKPTTPVESYNSEISRQHERLRILAQDVNCPEGSVPIRRARKEDLLRAKYAMESQPLDIHSLDTGYLSQHFAVLRTNTNSIHHGAEASLNTINPKVEDGQSSMALIWISSGDETIVTGWAVFPELYGDHKTHHISYWKSARGGCFNLLCSGFVQVDRSIPLDGVLRDSDISVYGKPQRELKISIHQDKNSKNWWLTYPYIYKAIGYWPGSLFPSLIEGATSIEFGGLARGPKYKGTPPMGWGTFPTKNLYITGYFFDMKTYDNDYKWTSLVGDWSEYCDNRNCYGVKSYGEEKLLGYNIEYGGPGGKYCGN